MSCNCGGQRAAQVSGSNQQTGSSDPVFLSYLGVRPIIVKGPITGHPYRFVPGSPLRVNAMDAQGMLDIPGLRRN